MSINGEELRKLQFSDPFLLQANANSFYVFAHKLKIREIHQSRELLAMHLAFYTDQLKTINADTFRYLSKVKKEALTEQLKLTYFLLFAQYQLDKAKGEKLGLQKYLDNMKICERLIDKLSLSERVRTPETLLAEELADSDKPLKFFGLTLVAPFFVKSMMSFIEGNVGSFSEAMTRLTNEMSHINVDRRTWIWRRGMVASALAMIPNNFYHTLQARDVIAFPGPFAGYLSWTLYYARFGIQLALLLRHTFNGPWMSEEEAEIPFSERFWGQWKERKYILINDAIWAPGNKDGRDLVCVLLLVMDVVLLARSFWEACNEQQEMIEEMKQARGALQKAFDLAQEGPEKKALKLQLDKQDKLIRKTEFDWTFKKAKFINDLVYATALVVSFSLVCCFFSPPLVAVPATQLLFALVGNVLCFVLHTVQAGVNNYIDIVQLQQSSKLLQEERVDLVRQFLSIPNLPENQLFKKQLYLDIKGLEAHSKHDYETAQFQKMELIHSVTANLLLPALLFSSFVFLPLFLGLEMLVIGVAIAFFVKIEIERLKPNDLILPEFDLEAYEQFKIEAPLEAQPATKVGRRSIFSSSHGTKEAELVDDLQDPLLTQ